MKSMGRAWIVALLWAAGVPAAGQSLSVTDFEWLGTFGFDLATGQAVNNVGDVAGVGVTGENVSFYANVGGQTYTRGKHPTRESMVGLSDTGQAAIRGWDGVFPKALLWDTQTGGVEAFPFGVATSAATGINGSGRIVGFYRADDSSVVFGGAFIEPRSDRDYYAGDVNEAGDIVGLFHDDSLAPNERLFIYNDDGLEDLGPLGLPGIITERGLSINDHRQIAGEILDASYLPHAYTWNEGVATLLPAPHPYARAHGISNDGVIIGESFSLTSELVPVVWYDNGVDDIELFTLQSLLHEELEGANVSPTFDISSNGWAVGSAGGSVFRFRLTPGDEFYWSNPEGGLFAEGDHWDQGQAPEDDDVTTIGVAGSYTITFDESVANHTLLVGNSDAALIATLALGGHTYRVDAATIGGPEADSAVFTIGNGTLQVDGELTIANVDGVVLTTVGAGGRLQVAGTSTVGQTGNGSLAVTDGGNSSQGELVIAGLEDSIGTVEVTGSGSVLSATTENGGTGFITVGQSGIGSLEVMDGGTVNAETFVLGFAASTSEGDVLIQGPDSALNIAGNLVVGFDGQATFDVIDGATASVAHFIVGHSANLSTGSASVVDATLMVNESVTIATGFGSSELFIRDGGSVVVAGGAGSTTSITATGVIPEFGLQGMAQLSVSGAGSKYEHAGGEIIVATTTNDTPSIKVEDGGLLTAGGMMLGADAEKRGAMQVTGTGSRVEVTGNLTVGASGGVGRLDIGPGGTVEAGSLGVSIAPAIGGASRVGVEGSNALLRVTGNVAAVGRGGGHGALDVKSGGKVEIAPILMHVGGPESIGVVTVDGVDSMFMAPATELLLGYQGADGADFFAQAGAAVKFNRVSIGHDAGEDTIPSNLNVLGAGTTFDVLDSLSVGGKGAMNVTANGTLAAKSIEIEQGVGFNVNRGTVTVAESLTFGGPESTLAGGTIENAGQVTSGSTIIGGGEDDTSLFLLTVTGESSFLDTGTLTIRENASVSVVDKAAILVSGDTTAGGLGLSVSGQNTRFLNVSGKLVVNGGSDISNDATATINSVAIASLDDQPVKFSVANGAELEVYEAVNIGDRATFEVSSGGEATIGGLNVSGVASSEGDPTLLVSGANSRLRLDDGIGNISVGTGTGAGKIEVRDGGRVESLGLSSQQVILGNGELPAEGHMTIDGGTWQQSQGTLRVGTGDANGYLSVAGGGEASFYNVLVSEEDNLATGAVTVTGAGSVLRVLSTLTMGGSELAPATAKIVLTGDGAINVGAGVPVAGRLRVGAGGSLLGRGVITPNTILDTGGTIASGFSPGTLIFEGDLDVLPGGMLLVDIGGHAAGSQHDLLDVAGDATINGSVLLKFINGFAPRKDDVFEFLTAGGAVDFSGASFTIANLAPGFEYDVAFDGGSLHLVALNDGAAVPEPASWLIGLLVLGGLGVGDGRRNARRSIFTRCDRASRRA